MEKFNPAPKDFMTLFRLELLGGPLKRLLLLSILAVCIITPMHSQAQTAPIGVEVECDQSTVNINVHPEQNEPVIVSCTVTNTGTATQDISLDGNVDGNDFSLSLSEDSFEKIAAGDEESFTATFAASPRIAVLSEDFNITATVVSWGMEPIMVPLGMFGSTSEVGGTVNSMPYSRMDLEVSNPSTRNIEVGQEETLQFTVFNDGNRIDNIEVEVVNQFEIEDAGFTFVSDPFFRATVNPGASSDQGTIILEAPNSAESEISVQIELRAYSKLDTTAEASEVSVRVVVAPSSGGGGSIGVDTLETLDSDSVAVIGMAGGGLIGIIILLVIISRLTKRAGKQKIAAKEAKKSAKANKRASKRSKSSRASKKEKVEDDFDIDGLDELDDLDDDFDFDDI